MEAARAWLTGYVCSADARVGRPGAVCPFVQPALRADTLRLELWPLDPKIGVAGLVSLVRDMVAIFEGVHWASRNRTLHALVVVLDGLPMDRLGITDEAQRRVKQELAAKGLMLGQFHAECEERAVRNPSFRVSRSPVPMLALRHMAVHDVLFLDGDSRSFAAYDQRYGSRYDKGAVPDPLFVERFTRGRARFGAGALGGAFEAGTAVGGEEVGALVTTDGWSSGERSSDERPLQGVERSLAQIAGPAVQCRTDRGAM
ncbi:DUF6875 domain-containing protein [Streptomyces sp. NPDC097981]|uniref:DUF6875 domain-containing protein n=1 Tax=Streptomyces sp. NPDC097981 TaxID=3155428 RepID=UPI0033181792